MKNEKEVVAGNGKKKKNNLGEYDFGLQFDRSQFHKRYGGRAWSYGNRKKKGKRGLKNDEDTPPMNDTPPMKRQQETARKKESDRKYETLYHTYESSSDHYYSEDE